MDKESILKDVVKFKHEFIEMLNEGEELPSVILDKYEILTLISKSKRSEVYLIKDKNTRIKRILKVYDRPEGSRDNLLKELSHTAIPIFVESHLIDNKIYLVREYFEGVSLDEYVEKNGVLSAKKTIKIARALLDILNYLHTRKTPIIYRDIKAENIIIDTEGSVKLVDFDISRKYDEKSSKDTVYYGTKQYSPPEQFGYSQTDARTDIYAVGVLMVYLTTFSTDIKSIENLDNERLAKVIKKCTSFSPKDRYKNATELDKALASVEKTKNIGFMPLYTIIIMIVSLVAGFVLGVCLERNNIISGIFSPAGQTNIAVFESDLIEDAVRAQLGKQSGENIYLSELDKIEYLHIWGNAFYDDSRRLLLSSAPDFGNVSLKLDNLDGNEEVKLTRGSIESLDDLLMFKNIKSLHLVYQNISDISALSYLPLEELNVAGNNITDLYPLESCIKIESLNIDGNPVSDISALSKLSYLTDINASSTAINDLSPLSKLYKLRYIYINNAFVDDVTPLTNLELEDLFLENNKIKDFSSLPSVNNLSIEGNP